MVHNIYKLWDKVSKSTILLGTAPTDGAFLRDTLGQWLRMRRIEDLSYYKIGTWNPDTDEIVGCAPEVCSMDAYKFPENKSQSLSAEDVKKLAEEITRREALARSQE